MLSSSSCSRLGPKSPRSSSPGSLAETVVSCARVCCGGPRQTVCAGHRRPPSAGGSATAAVAGWRRPVPRQPARCAGCRWPERLARYRRPRAGALRRGRSSADLRRRSCSCGRCRARGTDRRDSAWRDPRAYRPRGPYGSRARRPERATRPGVRARASRPTHFSGTYAASGSPSDVGVGYGDGRRTGNGSGAGGAKSTPVPAGRVGRR